MTDHEMRIRLVSAMGWTDIQTSKISGQMHGVDPDGNAGTIPNPLESDRDAARLRAWCVGRGWTVETRSVPDGPHYRDGFGDRAWCRVTVRWEQPVVDGQYWAFTREEPDPCRRERLALCRAVVQALDADQAGGEP